MVLWKRLFSVSVIFWLALLVVVQPGCKESGNTPDPVVVPLPDYWPTTAWQNTYPEQQGMSSGLLADMLDEIQTQNRAIRSVLVIRKGYLVLEAYFHPFQENFWHVIHSCTKSVNSTLIGIAIDQGHISDINQTVLGFFSEYDNVANMSQRKQSLALKHLLMMGTGMNARDSYLYDWEGLSNMQASDDWTKYVLDLPMIADPGATFDYSNCSAYLIAAILQQATDQNALDFAKQHLFNYLGIPSDLVRWPASPQGVNYGWGNMFLRPEDMARFGFLFLHRGKWDGQQVVSEDWVDQATRRHIHADTLAENYGYQWWVDSQGYYLALGYSGQYIIVHPQKNLIVVFSSALADQDFQVPEMLYSNYVLPSIQSDSAIAEDTQAQTRLDNIISSIYNPTPTAVPELPAVADTVSGVIYDFDTNTGGFNYVGLTFTVDDSEALLDFSYGERILKVPAGLDNVYRSTFQDDYWRSLKGWWQDDYTFVMDYQLADFSQRSKIWLTFSNDGTSVHMRYRNERSGDELEVNGTAAAP